MDFLLLPGAEVVNVDMAMAKGKDTFGNKLALLTLVMLGPLLVPVTLMSMQPSVRYWIGNAGLFVSALVVLLSPVGQLLLARKSLPKRTAVILNFVFPTAALMVTAYSYKAFGMGTASTLDVNDCQVFPGKVQVERAWQEANDILDKCVHSMADLTNTSAEEVMKFTVVTQCDGYEQGLQKWGPEWRYLSAMERGSDCSGWCNYHAPLWHSMASTSEHSCSRAAASYLGESVVRTSNQVIIYGFILNLGNMIILSTVGI